MNQEHHLRLSILPITLLLVFLTGCESRHSHGDHDHDHSHAHDHDHDHEHSGGGHAHTAPHGGTLVVLGDHFAHLEIVHDRETGRLDAYVLDAEAERGVKIPNLELRFTYTAGDEMGSAVLQPVESQLSGEKAGDTSHFSGMVTALKSLSRFHLVLEEISVRGSDFEGVSFGVPEGNEDQHRSDRDHDH